MASLGFRTSPRCDWKALPVMSRRLGRILYHGFGTCQEPNPPVPNPQIKRAHLYFRVEKSPEKGYCLTFSLIPVKGFYMHFNIKDESDPDCISITMLASQTI